jgi:hypothetical protein
MTCFTVAWALIGTIIIVIAMPGMSMYGMDELSR